MPRVDEKRFYRELKRTIKKIGNKRRRCAERRALAEHPEQAHWTEYEFGRNSSAWLNGLAEDKTRLRKGKRHLVRGAGSGSN